MNDIIESPDFELHPDADKFAMPDYDEPGDCICGAEIPAMKDWKHPGMDWSSVECKGCGRKFVDEETHIAIYEDSEDDDS